MIEGQMSIFDLPQYLPDSPDRREGEVNSHESEKIGQHRFTSDEVGKTSVSKLDKPRAPIWHMSLNHCWEECPNCKAYNKGQKWEIVGHGVESHGVWLNLDRCPECGQKLDWSDEAVEKACKYSKDYLEAQKREENGKKIT